MKTRKSLTSDKPTTRRIVNRKNSQPALKTKKRAVKSPAHSPADLAADRTQLLIEIYAVNERMNQIILEHLDPAAWRARLPGSRTRTIAAIVAHIHNVRRKWLRLSAPHIKLPPPLDHAHCTQNQARAALAQSAALCNEMLADALSAPQSDPPHSNPPRQVETFLRDGWARPWPAGPAMLAYMISHDAHHRGQIGMLAHYLGFPLPIQAGAGIWVWEKLWKDCGFTHPR